MTPLSGSASVPTKPTRTGFTTPRHVRLARAPHEATRSARVSDPAAILGWTHLAASGRPDELTPLRASQTTGAGSAEMHHSTVSKTLHQTLRLAFSLQSTKIGRASC